MTSHQAHEPSGLSRRVGPADVVGRPAWRLSFERITEWLARYDALAASLGYRQFDGLGRRRTISLAQYSRRLQELGLLLYFLTFVALVLTLLRMGLIQGWDVIIDSSLLAA